MSTSPLAPSSCLSWIFLNQPETLSPEDFLEVIDSRGESLMVPHGEKMTLPLDMEDDAFSEESLEERIDSAVKAKKDYIFALAKDVASEETTYFFDGISLCRWLSLSSSRSNPYNNQEITEVEFYIVPKELLVDNFKEDKVKAYFLCDLKEYSNEKGAFFHHMVNRADPEDPDPDRTECNLMLDLLLGRGIARNQALAFQLIKEREWGGNRYCMLLLALIYREGICTRAKDPELGDELYRDAERYFEDSALTKEYYDVLVQTYHNAESFEDEEPEHYLRSQKLYHFL